jgi:hypothetical protein
MRVEERLEVIDARIAVRSEELFRASPCARHEPADVPRDGAGADVLEVVPDQPALGAQQVRHRGVAMERLSGQRALEDRRGQRVQLDAKPVDVLLRQ